MEIETWVSEEGISSPIPNPLPSELQNREIKVSGYAGVWNSSEYSVGKIEAWLAGEQKFTIQHPLIWGARWAYCNGLYLILICRHTFAIFGFEWVLFKPTNSYPPWEHDFTTGYGSIFLMDTQNRPSYFYRAPSNYGELLWYADPPGIFTSTPEKSYEYFHFQNPDFYVDFAITTGAAIGAEIILNQLTGNLFKYSDAPKPSPVNEGGGGGGVGGNSKFQEIFVITSNESATFYPGEKLSTSSEGSFFPDYNQGYRLNNIIVKGEKARFSPFHPDFLEISIKISQVGPCPIKIAIDPAISGSGKDYFCLDYGEYNGLINRFINIDQKLDQLPP